MPCDCEEKPKSTDSMDLFNACSAGALARVKELVTEEGTDLMKKDAFGHTVTHWAAKSPNVEVLKYVIGKGAPLDERSEDETALRPIEWAVVEGNIAGFRYLCEKGVDDNCPDARGCLPIIIAAQHGQNLMITYLMKNGHSIESVDESGDNALHWAAYKGHGQTCHLLISLGLAIDSPDLEGMTPLHLACAGGSKSTCKIFVNQGASLSKKDNKNRNALAIASEKHNKSLVSYLNSLNSSRWNFLSYGKRAQKSQGPFIFFICSAIFMQFILLTRIMPSLENWFRSYQMFLIAMNIVNWFLFYRIVTGNPGWIEDEHLEKQYDAAIEEVAVTGLPDPNLNLCHTCRIVRPIRSKHCRVCDKCCHVMDHHCPWILNCVGQDTYLAFFMFLLTGFHNIIAVLVLGSVSLYMNGFDIWVAYLLIHLSLGSFFGVPLTIQHFYLVYKNLTTNEANNAKRYKYMQDKNGEFFNPFDHGWFKNMIDRFFITRRLSPSTKHKQEFLV
eukprot:TRINITY_DN773031_c0_g1_i1.p1 TRINITY_DN773031_c0_g1~~TRINITY_DN773031_c0_g1_i1.p1  ORF type:complete len:500 (-),score=93.44 TRINITY_DN773031_c0_g1_i1:297-1796(-)